MSADPVNAPIGVNIPAELPQLADKVPAWTAEDEANLIERVRSLKPIKGAAELGTLLVIRDLLVKAQAEAPERHRALAITKLEEAILWLGGEL
jgi:hypothetical protein